MPRISRESLSSSFLHVMVQGINKEYIFKKENDINTYMKLINKYIRDYNITIIAYCIMNNHVHLLMHTEHISELGKLMQRVNLVYSQYYNKENGRTGMLFRNRYKAESIFNLKYLINCIQYIHMNPVKAGMVKQEDDYKYSSCKEYMINGPITKSEIMINLFGNDCNFKEMLKKENSQIFLDIDKPSEYEIREYIDFSLNEYRFKNNINLVDILTDRRILKDVILYLKNEHRIQYKMIMQRLEIGRKEYIRLFEK